MEYANEQLKSSVASLETQVDRAENERRDVPQLRSELKSLEKLVADKESEIRRITEQLRKKDADLGGQFRKIEALEEEVKEAQR